MTTSNPDNRLKHLQASDIRGLTQLATRATLGVTGIVEGVNQSVWNTVGIPRGKPSRLARGITSLVFRSINGTTQLLGAGADVVLSRLEPLAESSQQNQPETPKRASVIAALNGVIGDRLVAGNNPLATPMTLRHKGSVLNWQTGKTVAGATGKVLLMIHGLCLNELKWNSVQQGRVPGHGEALASALGYTPVYLRYNSGLHTSQNGRDLSVMLEQLLQHWPVPINELTMLTHSMGGLVARSAVHYARQEGFDWPDRLKHIVFLGTPHHGAPLERAGNWVNTILANSPYSAPFTALGRLRSAGITDLRYGHVLDQDWSGHDRFAHHPDQRRVLPLPENVTSYTIAATRTARRSMLADRLTGDGLVTLNSALGKHDDLRRSLTFGQSSQKIVYRTTHMGLLSSPEVSRQLLQWLKAD